MIKQSTQGAVRILAIEGPLGADGADRLRDAVASGPRVGRPQVVLDLADTALIDSAGCEGLLDCRDALLEVGGAAHLAGLSPLCRDVLTATGVGRYFPTFEGVQQAVAHFAK